VKKNSAESKKSCIFAELFGHSVACQRVVAQADILKNVEPVQGRMHKKKSRGAHSPQKE
jgi:hypothetical protein